MVMREMKMTNMILFRCASSSLLPYSTDSDFSSLDISISIWIFVFVFQNKYESYKYERNTAGKSARPTTTGGIEQCGSRLFFSSSRLFLLLDLSSACFCDWFVENSSNILCLCHSCRKCNFFMETATVTQTKDIATSMESTWKLPILLEQYNKNLQFTIKNIYNKQAPEAGGCAN